MTQEERAAYIQKCHRLGITPEQQIREYLPLLAAELGNNYGAESHIRMARYTADVRWLLGEIDRLRAVIWSSHPGNVERVRGLIGVMGAEPAPRVIPEPEPAEELETRAVWQGWDLQNVPSAKDLLATIPGDFAADAELLSFFYGNQWHPEVMNKRLAQNPTRECLVLNQLPFIYATALSKTPNFLRAFSDLLKAWIAHQNMDAQRMYNYMASSVVERAACKTE